MHTEFELLSFALQDFKHCELFLFLHFYFFFTMKTIKMF